MQDSGNKEWKDMMQRNPALNTKNEEDTNSPYTAILALLVLVVITTAFLFTPAHKKDSPELTTIKNKIRDECLLSTAHNGYITHFGKIITCFTHHPSKDIALFNYNIETDEYFDFTKLGDMKCHIEKRGKHHHEVCDLKYNWQK